MFSSRMLGRTICGIPVRRVIRAVSALAPTVASKRTEPAPTLAADTTPARSLPDQVWILLAVCTLSALPWMVIEFKKAQFSVHYQGAPGDRVLRRLGWLTTPVG